MDWLLGKGVIICQDFESAQKAVKDMMIDKSLAPRAHGGNRRIFTRF